MLKKIKTVLAACRIIRADNPIMVCSPIDTTQQDVETLARIKRVRKMFEAQQAQMNARALQPHSCKDPLSCQKSKCWKWKPDKMVGQSYEVEDSKTFEARRKRNQDILDSI